MLLRIDTACPGWSTAKPQYPMSMQVLLLDGTLVGLTDHGPIEYHSMIQCLHASS